MSVQPSVSSEHRDDAPMPLGDRRPLPVEPAPAHVDGSAPSAAVPRGLPSAADVTSERMLRAQAGPPNSG